MVFLKRRYVFFVFAGSLTVLLATISPLTTGVLAYNGPGQLAAYAAPRPTPSDTPVFAAYKGVSVGMTTDAARKALGKPADQSAEQDSYVFSDNESAQIYYSAAKVVTAISITYSGNLSKAPKPLDVFGEAIEPKPDGGIFKMVRYPKAGFWISYNRTAGDDAIISIAIQKI